MTADFLYPTKAKTRVRPHLDKHRVNHLDSHPDLSAMSSTSHKVKYSTVIELLERGCWVCSRCITVCHPSVKLWIKEKTSLG